VWNATDNHHIRATGIARQPVTRHDLGGVFSFHIVRFVVAGVLLSAATLKALDSERTSSSWFVLAVIVELFLATWLISGLFPRYSWLAATICFVGFAGVSTSKVVYGELDCGCFGIVRTSPWVGLGIDAMAIVLLLFSFRVAQASQPARIRRKVLFGAVLVYCVLAMLAIGQMSTIFSREDLHTPGLSVIAEYVFVDADQWVHQTCPMLRFLDIDANTHVSVGEWFIVFYRDDCGECELLLERMSREGAGCIGARDDQVLLVTVTHDGGSRQERGLRPGFREARLRDTRKWIMRTPLVVRIVDAKVETVVRTPLP